MSGSPPDARASADAAFICGKHARRPPAGPRRPVSGAPHFARQGRRVTRIRQCAFIPAGRQRQVDGSAERVFFLALRGGRQDRITPVGRNRQHPGQQLSVLARGAFHSTNEIPRGMRARVLPHEVEIFRERDIGLGEIPHLMVDAIEDRLVRR